MIPNVIHFIFGLNENFGERPFSYVHYLSIKSAYLCNKPDAIKFYYKYEPSGEWWDKAKGYLTLIKVEPPTEVFGNPLLHYAHQADVLRLEILIKEGGIYLDIDVLCLNSFEVFRKYQCVMGLEALSGLCNAVIMAEPDSKFLKMWFETYTTFNSKGKDKFWSVHSVIHPYRIAKENPKIIHVADRFSFFWPIWRGNKVALWDSSDTHLFKIWKRNLQQWVALNIIKGSYCVHLYESIWWDEFLKEITPEYIKNRNNNFSKLCKELLSSKNGLGGRKKIIKYFLCKSFIDAYEKIFLYKLLK